MSKKAPAPPPEPVAPELSDEARELLRKFEDAAGHAARRHLHRGALVEVDGKLEIAPWLKRMIGAQE